VALKTISIEIENIFLHSSGVLMGNRIIIFMESALFGAFGMLVFMAIAFAVEKLTGKRLNAWKHYYTIGFLFGATLRTVLIGLLNSLH